MYYADKTDTILLITKYCTTTRQCNRKFKSLSYKNVP